MQIDTLKFFCDVVLLGSFSRAAANNNVTQSSVSQSIKHLEHGLGEVLIDRKHRPWKLTPEGKIFYQGCQKIVEQYYALEAEVKGFHDRVTSIVRVASIYSAGLLHMKQFVSEFTQQNPGVNIHLEYLPPNRIYESILSEEIDIGILSFPKSNRNINVIPWHFEPMVIAVHPQHRLAVKKQIAISEIAHEKFIGFDKNLVIRKEIDRFLKRNRVEVEVVLEFDNIEAIKRAVEIASGISILPRPTLDKELETGTLKSVPFLPKKLVRPLGIIHLKGKTLNVAVGKFIALLKSRKLHGKKQ